MEATIGFGDQLMASGMARGAAARGKRIAFGDGQRIIWDPRSAEIFRGNPNIARPGQERDDDIEWINYFKGHRLYNQQDPPRRRWIWNKDFRPIPGELFFERNEMRNGERRGKDFVLIEPNVEFWKTAAANKDWGLANYQAVADELLADDYRVVQLYHEKSRDRLNGVELVKTLNFRDALGILSHAALYIGPEGGLHHGAAAVGVKGVVLFGGFIPPSVTGYEGHANLTGGSIACGRYTPCRHCAEAMKKISVDEVLEAARDRL